MTDANRPYEEPPRPGLLDRLSAWLGGGARRPGRRPGALGAGPAGAVRLASLRAAAARAPRPAPEAGGAEIIPLPRRACPAPPPALDMAEADLTLAADALPPRRLAPPPLPEPEAASPLQTAELLCAVVEHEAAALLRDARARTAIPWSDFVRSWQRLARRIAAGETAADDLFLSDLVSRLAQGDGRPLLQARRKALTTLLHGRLREHLARRSPGSLSSRLAAMESGPERGTAESAARWILALDATGQAAFRALAVAAAAPALRERARAAARPGAAGAEARWLQACIVEAGRLWPAGAAVPARPAGGGARPSDVAVLEGAGGPRPARRFQPELWQARDEDARVVAFQPGGVGEGRILLPTIAANFLAALLREGDVRLEPGLTINPDALPERLDQNCVRIRFERT